MKKITKGTEPTSLTSYRSSIAIQDLENSSIYEGFRDKTKNGCSNGESQNLRKQLLEEQGYICCYCMGRISCKGSKIEHFKSQTHYRNLQIDYQNLFVACSGGEGRGHKEQFCDTKKGEQDLLTINLLENIENDITYSKNNSAISISSVNNDMDYELNIVLNLNSTTLQKSRKEIYDNVIKNLKQKKFTVPNIKKIIQHYKIKHDNGFEPYCEMIIYFLTKKLKSQGVTA